MDGPIYTGDYNESLQFEQTDQAVGDFNEGLGIEDLGINDLKTPNINGVECVKRPVNKIAIPHVIFAPDGGFFVRGHGSHTPSFWVAIHNTPTSNRDFSAEVS